MSKRKELGGLEGINFQNNWSFKQEISTLCFFIVQLNLTLKYFQKYFDFFEKTHLLSKTLWCHKRRGVGFPGVKNTPESSSKV